MTSPTALAAPVVDGIIFAPAALPALQSFPPFDAPSTVNYVAVTAWTVVINPSIILNLSWITFANGAKQLVVQEALLTMFKSALYLSWLTPITNIGVLSFGGADIITFLAPPFKCASAVS